mmetsp:Transcript_8284/g.17907  ORF Transcript_8284/g.17907 Transcript_8284/m.17907 type:complete len:349 (-) Transcript_8284:74-1120(-)
MNSRKHLPTILTPDLIRDILDGSGHGLFTDATIVGKGGKAEIDICREMISELTPEQLEQAARTSYAYYVAATSSDESLHGVATDEARQNMAMRMARRHLVQMKGDQEEATRIMKAALTFRKDRQIDALRACYAVAHDGSKCASLSIREEELPDADQMESYRKLIKNDLDRQPMVVRGHDMSNRAILIKFPRISAETDVEAYVMAHLYIAERAMAATEILSRGKEEKIVALLDFETYSSSCKPPLSAMRLLIPLLQTNYPERVDHIVIVEPSFWMRAVFKLLSMFIDPHTMEKIVLINGETQRINKLKPLVAKEQAMPFMLPDGELTAKVDINHYLENVPFFSLYDAEV